VIRRRAEPQQYFAIQTEGGQLVTDALLGSWDGGLDDPSQPLERHALVIG